MLGLSECKGGGSAVEDETASTDAEVLAAGGVGGAGSAGEGDSEEQQRKQPPAYRQHLIQRILREDHSPPVVMPQPPISRPSPIDGVLQTRRSSPPAEAVEQHTGYKFEEESATHQQHPGCLFVGLHRVHLLQDELRLVEVGGEVPSVVELVAQLVPMHVGLVDVAGCGEVGQGRDWGGSWFGGRELAVEQDFVVGFLDHVLLGSISAVFAAQTAILLIQFAVGDVFSHLKDAVGADVYRCGLNKAELQNNPQEQQPDTANPHLRTNISRILQQRYVFQQSFGQNSIVLSVIAHHALIMFENHAFFLRVSWSQRTIWVQSGEQTSLLETFSSSLMLGFTLITFLSRLFLNSSPDSPLPESTLKLGLSLEAQTPVFQLQQLRSVGLGMSRTFPSKIGLKSSVFSRWAQSIQPEISCFLPGTSILRKMMVSHLPLRTFSSLSASRSRKGSILRLGIVEARDLVLSFVRLSLASSMALFLVVN